MIRPSPWPEAAKRSLAGARRSVLLALLVCGVGVLAASGEPRPLTGTSDSLLTTVVIVLALGAVVSRQFATRRVRAQTRARWLLATYAFSAALGFAGLWSALVTGESLRGIGYVVAGALFALAGWRVEAATPNLSG